MEWFVRNDFQYMAIDESIQTKDFGVVLST